MKVRRATLDDVPAIVHVINRAYRVEEFFVTGDRISEAEVQARMEAPHACFLVVDDEAGSTARLAAAVYVDVRGERGYFGMLSVDPDRQKSGLGRLLVSAAEQHCRAAGCRDLDMVMVNLRLELPAFYERLGFSISGTQPFPDPDRLLRAAHLVMMTKAIRGDS